jgi:hypothetical protein
LRGAHHAHATTAEIHGDKWICDSYGVGNKKYSGVTRMCRGFESAIWEVNIGC